MNAGASTAVGVDLGTTYTCAAVSDGSGRPARIVQLSGTSQTIPSVVSITDDGVVAGDAAERRLVSHPSMTAREFKRRLGDATPIVLGSDPYPAEVLSGHLLREVLDRVEQQEGRRPDVVGLAHPASWGPFRLDLLRDAGRNAGVDDVVLVPEPVAAAMANRDRVEPGSLVAVYDLGGGTFDAAIVRVGEAADDVTVVGTPEGVERLGGIDFDQAVMAHVDAATGGQVFGQDRADPETRGALMRLRTECQAAKEHLSEDTDVDISVALPGLQTTVRMTRAEFEAAVRPRLADSLAVFDRVAASAGAGWDDISAVLLVGGSSNIPVVAQLVGEHTGRPVITATNPHLAIAAGTATVTAQRLSSAPPAAPVAAAPASATPPPADPPVTSGDSRSKLPLIIGVLVAAALAIGGFVLFTGGDDDEPAATETTPPEDSAPDDDPDANDPDDDTDTTEPETSEPETSEPDDGDTEPDPPAGVEVTIAACTTVAPDTVAVLPTENASLIVGPGETRLVDGLGPDDCTVDPAGGTPIELAAPGTPIAGMSFGDLYAIATDASGLVGSVGTGTNRECDLIAGPGAVNGEGAVFTIGSDGTVSRIRTDGGQCDPQDNSLLLGITASTVGFASNDTVAIGGTIDGGPALRLFIGVEEGIDVTDDDLPGLAGVDAIVRCDDRWCALDLTGQLLHVLEYDTTVRGSVPLAGTPLADAVAVRSASGSRGGVGVMTLELADGSVSVVTVGG